MCPSCDERPPLLWIERIARAVPLIGIIYAHPSGGTGGPLHVVIDDGNTEDEHVAWYTEADMRAYDWNDTGTTRHLTPNDLGYGDPTQNEIGTEAAVELLALLTGMTEAERDQAIDYHQGWAPIPDVAPGPGVHPPRWPVLSTIPHLAPLTLGRGECLSCGTVTSGHTCWLQHIGYTDGDAVVSLRVTDGVPYIKVGSTLLPWTPADQVPDEWWATFNLNPGAYSPPYSLPEPEKAPTAITPTCHGQPTQQFGTNWACAVSGWEYRNCQASR